MKKIEKVIHAMNTEFPARLAKQFKEQFGVEVINTYCLLENRYTTERADGELFTQEQFQWMDGYSNGYRIAMDVAAGVS